MDNPCPLSPAAFLLPSPSRPCTSSFHTQKATNLKRIPRRLSDMFEPVRSEVDTSKVSSDDDEDIEHVEDLQQVGDPASRC